VRLGDFGDGNTAAPAAAYRSLPNIADSEVQNRCFAPTAGIAVIAPAIPASNRRINTP
jgi:hypothetical protein